MSEALIGEEQTGEVSADTPTDGLGQETEATEQDAFIQRLMSDEDFAREQFLKREKTISSLSNKVKELEPVSSLVELAGGTDPLQRLATLGAQVEQTPGLSEVVLGAVKHGRYEAPQVTQDGQDDPDEWMDPDVKEALAPRDQQIAQLQAELAELKGVAYSADLHSKQRRIEENIGSVLAPLKDQPKEIFEEAQKALEESYGRAFEAAEAGNREQAALLDRIANPQEGPAILDAVLGKIYKRIATSKALESDQTESESNVVNLRKATDEGSQTAARPGPPQIPTPPRGTRPGPVDFRKAMEAAARNMGMDPNS